MLLKYTGGNCGVVKHDDRKSGKKICYTKAEQKWPMECIEEMEATPLPDNYKSPPAPWELGQVLGKYLSLLLASNSS